MTVPRILIIAGSDSGGGAGIQADIKTVTMLGGHAMTAITAITAQNTLGVEAVMPVPTEIVLRQIEAVLADLGADAIKIGMIGSAETAAAIASRIEALHDIPIVFDPVMVATSGSVLADEATIAGFERLMRLSTLVTPNLPELETLAGAELSGEDEIVAAAAALYREHGCRVLAKGGHSAGGRIDDFLIWEKGTIAHHSDRVDTLHTHGTGCTLASAIATGLGGGLPLDRAVDRGLHYVHAAILAAPGFGRGNGPIGHSLATTPYHHLKAAQEGGEWGVETWDSVWSPGGTRH
ncbi:MAG TPA: bifunctional hydroxymethylpyrimidine kinase/phosphomethylpyrimidine kinase [Allosphingosinicella sp.]|jgi:hydroxymethylpyrimidine/phosphomethylpyrimidine kinase